MTDQIDVGRIMDAVGFTFKNPELLISAFRHPSYREEGKENNERLVFLGKRLLDFILADYIYQRYPFTPENELSDKLSEYSSMLSPDTYIERAELSGFVLLSKHAEALRKSPALCEEIFYALIAAIYKDGGLASLKSFLLPMLRFSDEMRYVPAPVSKPKETVKETLKEESLKNEAAPYVPGTENAVNLVSEPKKKSKGLLKVIGHSQKEKKVSVTEEQKTEQKEKKNSPFIRDALTPVRLSDDLRNPKPSAGKQKNKKDIPAEDNIPPKTENRLSDGENYKSMLQEYVQKNIRTANVLIKYETKNISKNELETVITLDGKILAKAVDTSKKAVEKQAAHKAYIAITDGELAGWFASAGEGNITPAPPVEDYVSKLNQYFQKKQHSSSTPVTYEKRQSQNKKMFTVAAVTEKGELAVGTASSLKEAKQDAAKKACEVLKI